MKHIESEIIVYDKLHSDYRESFSISRMPRTNPERQRLGLLSINEYVLSLASTRSRQTVQRYLNVIAKNLGADSIENINFGLFKENIIRGLVSVFSNKYSPSTTKTCLCIIRGICKRLKINDVLTEKEYTLIKEIKFRGGYREPKGRALSKQEIDEIFKVLDQKHTYRSVRDAAIIAILVMCGLRRAECAALKMDNLYLNTEDPYFKFVGKGNKERTCFIPKKALVRLNAWLELRDYDTGFLFTRVLASGEILDLGLSGQAIYNVVRDAGHDANITNWTPHDLRRTFATELLSLNVDVVTVKDMMGHSNVNTTSMYDRRGKDRMKKAAQILDGAI